MQNKIIHTGEYKTTLALIALSLVMMGVGSFASITITRKKFLENFNHMNGYYKQTLFLTGQSKREEAKAQYDLLAEAYTKFHDTYRVYRPFSIRSDMKLSQDLVTVEKVLKGVKDGVYTGDLPQTHKQLEAVRPIFQEMFKRNGFSMLSMALVDFHDIMETIIAASDVKNAAEVLTVYPQVDAALRAIETEDTSTEIQTIRTNLEAVKAAAESGAVESLPSKAAALKASFIKVYLVKG
jgi:hypothetical protein